MNRIVWMLSGYVKIFVQGKQLSRFLNLCRSRGITLKQVCPETQKQMTAEIAIQDFKALKPIARRTHVYVHILKKCGMPFFFYRSRKRKAFFAGILICLCLLFLFVGRVWEIRIEGNRSNSTPELLGFMKEQGVMPGIEKSKIDCFGLAALLRKKYENITWVSVRLDGIRLQLQIQEEKRKKEKKNSANPCDLKADADGKIVKMMIRQGTPLAAIGQECKKGDILVSGIVEIRNDAQEVVREEYVHADADIYLEKRVSYYSEFPLKYKKYRTNGKRRTFYYLKLGNLYLGKRLKSQKNRRICEEEFLNKKCGCFLPVSFGKITEERIELKEAVFSKEEAQKKALHKLWRYEKKLEKQGCEIKKCDIKTRQTDHMCITSGTLTILAKTGKESKIEVKEEKTEETHGE